MLLLLIAGMLSKTTNLFVDNFGLIEYYDLGCRSKLMKKIGDYGDWTICVCVVPHALENDGET